MTRRTRNVNRRDRHFQPRSSIYQTSIMTSTIPRFLLPRGSKPLSPQYRSLFAQSRVQALRQTPICKYASTKTPKPRVLEKPDKFNPPSHPARLNKSPPRQFPGPPLSGAQKEAQMKKKYPHTMPPKDSFMNWFITNRSIHVWITLVRYNSSLWFWQFSQSLHLHSLKPIHWYSQHCPPSPSTPSPPISNEPLLLLIFYRLRTPSSRTL